MPGDAAILAAAAPGIEELNAATRRPERPLLPLPPRAAVEPEGRRLHGLGAQAREDRGVQPPPARRGRGRVPRPGRRRSSILPSVRYVLTLDTDTRLPRDAARTLIGILAHPLNRPVFDRSVGRVDRGLRHPAAARERHATRAPPARSSRASTRATRASTPTRPPSPTPTRTSSARGSSRARASTTSTRSGPRSEARVPENALLSHDLFEGLHARTALVSDVEVVDDYPRERPRARAPAAPLGARRLADPRLALPASSRRADGFAKNRLPLISQWKILDNLRRSLVAPALLALLRRGVDRPARQPARLDARRPRGRRASRSSPRSCAFPRQSRDDEPVRVYVRGVLEEICARPSRRRS